jgi:acetyl-CoA carboxylase biotin carboxylase subunit
VYSGWVVPMDYDPLLAKLCVWAGSREAAIDRMLRALDETRISGIRTNIAFFRRLLRDEEFRRGALHTGFIDEFFGREASRGESDPNLEVVAALVAVLSEEKGANPAPAASSSRWLTEGRRRLAARAS